MELSLLFGLFKGSRKKFFYRGPATERGWGVKGRATKKKVLFLKIEKKIRKNVATKLEKGGGGRP